MSALRSISRINSVRRIAARISAWLILLCVVFSSLSVSARAEAKSNDLVFCPLQKTWVQRYVAPVKYKEPLDEICASPRQKSSFFAIVSKKVPLLRFVPNSREAEKLFFQYLEKGKQAFSKLAPAPNLPESQLGKLADTEKSGSNYQTDFSKDKAESFIFARHSRPPPVREVSFLAHQIFYKLETISRRIQPRAPPVSL